MISRALFLKNRAPNQERGIALAVVILILFVLTTLSAAVISLTQSEIWTSGNYTLTTQARYVAEAGSQRTANWLIYRYNPPSTTAAFDTTKSPVQYAGKAVVLSADSSVEANYPDATVKSAFRAALLNQTVPGMGNNSTSAVTATLMSMK